KRHSNHVPREGRRREEHRHRQDGRHHSKHHQQRLGVEYLEPDREQKLGDAPVNDTVKNFKQKMDAKPAYEKIKVLLREAIADYFNDYNEGGGGEKASVYADLVALRTAAIEAMRAKVNVPSKCVKYEKTLTSIIENHDSFKQFEGFDKPGMVPKGRFNKYMFAEHSNLGDIENDKLIKLFLDAKIIEETNRGTYRFNSRFLWQSNGEEREVDFSFPKGYEDIGKDILTKIHTDTKAHNTYKNTRNGGKPIRGIHPISAIKGFRMNQSSDSNKDWWYMQGETKGVNNKWLGFSSRMSVQNIYHEEDSGLAKLIKGVVGLAVNIVKFTVDIFRIVGINQTQTHKIDQFWNKPVGNVQNLFKAGFLTGLLIGAGKLLQIVVQKAWPTAVRLGWGSSEKALLSGDSDTNWYHYGLLSGAVKILFGNVKKSDTWEKADYGLVTGILTVSKPVVTGIAKYGILNPKAAKNLLGETELSHSDIAENIATSGIFLGYTAVLLLYLLKEGGLLIAKGAGQFMDALTSEDD
ncbi:MAG: hypothetical protein HRT90_01220, partial [Candidatus Margulisbacteria bacterium]|nr:hypothetical protein [Candidatus Margulisiibacteriota bacterium]